MLKRIGHDRKRVEEREWKGGSCLASEQVLKLPTSSSQVLLHLQLVAAAGLRLDCASNASGFRVFV